MNIIKTIDLWTEPFENHYECFNGAFFDGITDNYIPFDLYKIVKNCNCIIKSNSADLNIRNKHSAIVFYKNNIPVRLMVINKNTNVDNCINNALNQKYNNIVLKKTYKKNNVKSTLIDLKEKAIDNEFDGSNEIDVGSCDRWNLLYNMLKGSYTESESKYGNYQSDKYEFAVNINIKYELKLENEMFLINHNCAFINDIKTRIIPIQDNSKLTIGANYDV